MKTAVFTIASKNYFAYVRTIMQSLEASNPHMDRFAVVVDELDDEFVALPRNFELLELDKLELPHPNCFKFRYDIMEFNTAVKPFAILKLFETYDRVIYLDPDIFVYKKLQLVEDALDNGYNFVFTPHFNGLFEDDGMHPDEPDIMQAGIYNLGFIALNKCKDTLEMVSWWADKLEYQCINEQEKGIFVDQKWMDLVPGYYENVCILHNSGLNVAYWNLSHRTITKKEGDFYVNGEPLIFFHFSGLNPGNIEMVSKHQNRFRLSDLDDGAELFENYAKTVLSNEFDMWKKFVYSFGKYTDGRKILPEHRLKYRRDKNIQGYCGENPFACGWLFYGDREPELQKDGVNLVGYLYSEHGVGEAARLTANCLEAAQVSWCGFDYEVGNPCKKNDKSFEDKIENYIKYNISILNVNADQVPVLKNNTPKELWKTYKIGIWYWELPEFPEQCMKAFFDVDEIWAPTKYVADGLEKYAPCPVYHMPPGIMRKAVDETVYNRAYYGLPEDAFLFLNMFDVYSFSGRKNPEAAVKAFQKAFSSDDMSVGLVLKLNNGGHNSKESKKLKKLIGEYENIYIIAKTMPREAVNGLLNTCDVAVSLHRSEGLGLLCEEAMFYGKPVIATGWSGNMDFMTKDNACLVDYEMISVGEDIGPYEAWQQWADPSVEQASEFMKRLATDKEYYNEIAETAKSYIRDKFSPKICGQRMKERLAEISGMLRTDGVTRRNRGKDAAVMARACLSGYQKITGKQLTKMEKDSLVSSWVSGKTVDFDSIAKSIAMSDFVIDLSDEEFVRAAYEKILSRTPSEGEVLSWVNQLGLISREQVLLCFLKSEEFCGSYKEDDSIDEKAAEEEERIEAKGQAAANVPEISEVASAIETVLSNELLTLNQTYSIPYYGNLEGGAVKRFIKKVIRKVNKSLMLPIITHQTEFNADVVRYLNALQQRQDLFKTESRNLQTSLTGAMQTIKENEKREKKRNDTILQYLETLKDKISAGNEELLKEYRSDRVLAEELKRELQMGNVLTEELKQEISSENEQLKNVILTGDERIEKNITVSNSDLKEHIVKVGTDLKNQISSECSAVSIRCNEYKNTMIEVAGSRHNQLVHYLMELLENEKRDMLEEKVGDTELIKQAIKDKWALVDSYEERNYKNHEIVCPVCGKKMETDKTSRLISECIFNGGKLIRYVCPECGVVFGPEKMLNLDEKAFSDDYKLHYSVYAEGDSTEREIEVFRKLNPSKDEVYLDWGVGAWSTVIPSLREEGYQVYGYDPYAPTDSEYIITDEEKLRTMKFDGIFSHDLLEHLKDPVGTFRLFADVLKSRGKMIHSTACYDYVYEYTRFHLFFYTGRSIDKLCEETGFVVENIEKDPINLLISYTYSLKE